MLIIYISNLILSKITTGDHYILLIVSMLMSIGIIMIHRINPELGFKQIVWLVAGILLLFVSYFTVKTIKGWPHWTYLYVGTSFLLFMATLVFGRNIKGATNWIRIGEFSFQPAEIIKILFIFFLASYYANRAHLKNKWILAAIAYGNIAFLFIQKDLGSAMIFFAIYMAIIYVYETDRRFILYNIGTASVMALISYFIFSHVRVRWKPGWTPGVHRCGWISNRPILFAIAAGDFRVRHRKGYRIHPGFTMTLSSPPYVKVGILTGIAIIMLYLIFIYRGIKITLEQKILSTALWHWELRFPLAFKPYHHRWCHQDDSPYWGDPALPKLWGQLLGCKFRFPRHPAGLL